MLANCSCWPSAGRAAGERGRQGVTPSGGGGGQQAAAAARRKLRGPPRGVPWLQHSGLQAAAAITPLLTCVCPGRVHGLQGRVGAHGNETRSVNYAVRGVDAPHARPRLFRPACRGPGAVPGRQKSCWRRRMRRAACSPRGAAAQHLLLSRGSRCEVAGPKAWMS